MGSRRGGGLGQINTCRQVPLLLNFEEKSTFRVWCLYIYLVHAATTIPTSAAETFQVRVRSSVIRRAAIPPPPHPFVYNLKWILLFFAK
jgi:hypothetical protein